MSGPSTNIKRAFESVGTANRPLEAAAKSQEAFAKGAGLARFELINLGRQAQDVAVSLAGGRVSAPS